MEYMAIHDNNSNTLIERVFLPESNIALIITRYVALVVIGLTQQTIRHYHLTM